MYTLQSAEEGGEYGYWHLAASAGQNGHHSIRLIGQDSRTYFSGKYFTQIQIQNTNTNTDTNTNTNTNTNTHINTKRLLDRIALRE